MKTLALVLLAAIIAAGGASYFAYNYGEQIGIEEALQARNTILQDPARFPNGVPVSDGGCGFTQSGPAGARPSGPVILSAEAPAGVSVPPGGGSHVIIQSGSGGAAPSTSGFMPATSGGALPSGVMVEHCAALGEVKAVNGDTMQVTSGDRTVTIKMNDKTIVSKTEKGSVKDLKVGDRVIVFSAESGSVPTASRIQIQRLE